MRAYYLRTSPGSFLCVCFEYVYTDAHAVAKLYYIPIMHS